MNKKRLKEMYIKSQNYPPTNALKKEVVMMNGKIYYKMRNNFIKNQNEIR